MKTPFFSQPENQEDRKSTFKCQYTDIFPKFNPYIQTNDNMFPDKVTQYVHQFRAQEALKKSADLLNQHLMQLQLEQQQLQKNCRPLTDDQLRVQKIKERMMRNKRKK
jgi:hypothetical protein